MAVLMAFYLPVDEGEIPALGGAGKAKHMLCDPGKLRQMTMSTYQSYPLTAWRTNSACATQGSPPEQRDEQESYRSLGKITSGSPQNGG